MADNICSECQWWQRFGNNKYWGQCHLNPPSGFFQNWPETRPEEWCSKWQKKSAGTVPK